MLRKLISMLIVSVVALSLFVPVSAFAYGDVMPADAYVTTDGLIYVKRPESLSASTSDRTYTISAVGREGLNVAVYKYNSSTGDYRLVKGYTQIGASGLFSVVVDLTDDVNVFRLYATDWNDYQKADISVSKIKQSTIDKLKGLTVTVKNFFN